MVRDSGGVLHLRISFKLQREGCSCHEPYSLNDSNQDVLDSFQSLRLKSSENKVSPAMYSLQGYYGLKPADIIEQSLMEDASRWEITRPKLLVISLTTVIVNVLDLSHPFISNHIKLYKMPFISNKTLVYEVSNTPITKHMGFFVFWSFV